jgi:hypothetical protein
VKNLILELENAYNTSFCYWDTILVGKPTSNFRAICKKPITFNVKNGQLFTMNALAPQREQSFEKAFWHDNLYFKTGLAAEGFMGFFGGAGQPHDAGNPTGTQPENPWANLLWRNVTRFVAGLGATPSDVVLRAPHPPPLHATASCSSTADDFNSSSARKRLAANPASTPSWLLGPGFSSQNDQRNLGFERRKVAAGWTCGFHPPRIFPPPTWCRFKSVTPNCSPKSWLPSVD